MIGGANIGGANIGGNELLAYGESVDAPVLTRTRLLVVPTLAIADESVFASVLSRTRTLVPPTLSIDVDAPVLSRTRLQVAPEVTISVSPPALLRDRTAIPPTGFLNTFALPVLGRTRTLIPPTVAITVDAPVLTRTRTAAVPTTLVYVETAPPVLTRTRTMQAPTILESVSAPALSRTRLQVIPTALVSVASPVLTRTRTMGVAAPQESVTAPILTRQRTQAVPTLSIDVDAPVLTRTRLMVIPTLSELGDTTYTVYNVNAESGAPSLYTGVDFDSVVDLGEGNIYAVDADGVYTLGGTTDDGANIAATLRGPQLMFQGQRLTRLDEIDILADCDGELVAKVVAETEGSYVEYWYTPTETGDVILQEHVFKVGKGIKSRYWLVEVVNNAGSAGEIEKVDYYPIALSRKH